MTTLRRRPLLTVLPAVTAAALILGVSGCGDTTDSTDSTRQSDAAVQQALDGVIKQGIPGAQLVISDPSRGHSHHSCRNGKHRHRASLSPMMRGSESAATQRPSSRPSSCNSSTTDCSTSI